MPIKNWPTGERPREKLMHQGSAALSDAELLAIFLTTGSQNQDAVSLARQLLSTHGSLAGVLEASPAQLCTARGVGTTKYIRLQAALELGRRYLAHELEDTDVLTMPEQVCHYLSAQMQGYHREVFACLLLDNRHRVLGFKELFSGTINAATVYPREIVKSALEHNAAAVILAHNHPSGVAEPSLADRQLTREVQQVMALVDIRVLDHIIIGRGHCCSMAEQGLLK